MRHYGHGTAVAGKAAGRIHYAELVADVEKSRRFVHEHRPRALGEDHGQISALALPARELRQGSVSQLQRVGAAERRVNDVIVLTPVMPRIGEVGKAPMQRHAPDAYARHGTVLGHVCRPLRYLTGAELLHGPAVEQHLPAHALRHTEDGAQQRALAAAVRPGDGRDLPGRESDAYPVQYLECAVARAQLLKLNHGFAPSFA